MASEPLPLRDYPPVLLDAVAYTWAGDATLGTKILGELEPNLVIAQLVAMYGQLAAEHERAVGIPKGTLLTRLRQRYVADAEVLPLEPRERKQRRVQR